MADIDYGELRIYPGNYEAFTDAVNQARSQLEASNAKKQAEREDLQALR